MRGTVHTTVYLYANTLQYDIVLQQHTWLQYLDLDGTASGQTHTYLKKVGKSTTAPRAPKDQEDGQYGR